ncbi:unnamed protein product [Miscanthus lutarioriparius]|uniref:Uncharacterized protein n=1 Tax=Miscanthus lutarioriparius TaxID=422564 RepID=A0A811PF79_9POAL|nr:unnamed protein product [Miscanthus lutarioriparius]
MLGAGPQDEDIPEQVQIQGQLPFDFFGLGQNVLNQQVEPPQQQLQEQMDVAPNNEAAPEENNGWAEWPEHLQAAQQGPAQIEINLNAPPPVLLQDLNDLPIIEDHQEVRIHPGVQANQVQNNWELGMADNSQMEQEIHLPQPVQPEPLEVMVEEVAENAVEEDQIQLGMVRIYDRFYSNATGPSDLTTRKAPLTEQLFPAPPMKLNSNDYNPVGKASETALIEVPRKWADFFQSPDVVNVSLSPEPCNRKVELCGKLDSFSSSLIPEEAFILDEELNASPLEKKKQRKGKM